MPGHCFQFTKASIDHHIEKIGADVRPALELRLEKQHVMDFYGKVSEDHPDLFESLVFAPTEFAIKKTFEFPGKSGSIEMVTFSLSRRGPTLAFPHRIAELDAETDLPDMDDKAVRVLKTFQKVFPQCQFLRVGKVNEYVFFCGKDDSTRLVAGHFTRLSSPREVFIRFNLPTDDYNRVFTIEPVTKRQLPPRLGPIEDEGISFGIRVSVDFNNIDMSQVLNWERIRGVLAEATSFHEKEAFDLLNNLGGNT